MNKSRKVTIEKYTDFLEKLSKRKTINTSDFYKLIKENKINNSIISQLIELKYVSRIDSKNYKINLSKVMPIHAVSLLNNINTYRLEKKKAKVLNKKDLIVKNKKRKKPAKFKKEPTRQINLLWGLISLKF